MRVRLLVVCSILAVGLATVLLWPSTSSAQRDEVLTVDAEERSFEVVVKASGELHAARAKVLSSQIQGGRSKIVFLAKDGSRANKGDVLVRLDPTPFSQAVRQAEATLRESEAKATELNHNLKLERNEVDSDIRSAEFDHKVSGLDLKRLERGEGPLELARLEGAAHKASMAFRASEAYVADLKRLQKQGYASPIEVGKAEVRAQEAGRVFRSASQQHASYRDFVLPAKVHTARAEVERALLNLRQTRRKAEFKINKARAALTRAQKSMQSAEEHLLRSQKDLEMTVIRAPTSGMVVLPKEFRNGQRRKPRIGDTVWQGQPLVYLPDLSRMLAYMQVREIDLHKIEVGTPTTIRVDAFPREVFKGEVTSIGVLAEQRDNHKFFQVVVSLDASERNLRPGMTARAQMHCSDEQDVLSVPVQAVFRKGDDAFYCYVASSGKFERRAIELGAQNEVWTAVSSGLFSGEKVALSQPPDELILGDAPASDDAD